MSAVRATDVERADTINVVFVDYAERERGDKTPLVETARVLCALRLRLKGLAQVAEGDTYVHRGKTFVVCGIAQHWSSRAASETYTELLLGEQATTGKVR